LPNNKYFTGVFASSLLLLLKNISVDRIKYQAVLLVCLFYYLVCRGTYRSIDFSDTRKKFHCLWNLSEIRWNSVTAGEVCECFWM